MATINAKSRRGDAERAAVHFARVICGCVHTRRAVRTQFQSVDFFASDVVGKRRDGSHVYIQATAGQDSAVTARRRKLEQIPWHDTDTVMVVQLRSTEDPANARRKLWFFRVHEFSDWAGNDPDYEPDEWDIPGARKWRTWEKAVEVPKAWFKAWQATQEVPGAQVLSG